MSGPGEVRRPRPHDTGTNPQRGYRALRDRRRGGCEPEDDRGRGVDGVVIHHFGSKQGLRVACDECVAGAILTGKGAAIAAGSGLDPVQSIRDDQQGRRS